MLAATALDRASYALCGGRQCTTPCASEKMPRGSSSHLDACWEMMSFMSTTHGSRVRSARDDIESEFPFATAGDGCGGGGGAVLASGRCRSDGDDMFLDATSQRRPAACARKARGRERDGGEDRGREIVLRGNKDADADVQSGGDASVSAARFFVRRRCIIVSVSWFHGVMHVGLQFRGVMCFLGKFCQLNLPLLFVGCSTNSYVR